MNSFTSLCLKLTGLVFILSFLLDGFILPLPYQFNQSQWQVGFVTTFVDRGIVPLLGIILVLIAYWIDANNKDVIPRKSRFELRWPIFIFSTLLGLVFLLMIPVHINNINQIKNNALTQNQLQTQLQERRKQAESQANLEALKQWLRIGIQSMLLSISYSLIGWLGIRELGSMKKRTA